LIFFTIDLNATRNLAVRPAIEKVMAEPKPSGLPWPTQPSNLFGNKATIRHNSMHVHGEHDSVIMVPGGLSNTNQGIVKTESSSSSHRQRRLSIIEHIERLKDIRTGIKILIILI
jgi:hypothetical protein